jgi:glycine cleavage system aminomethyltransferase T
MTDPGAVETRGARDARRLGPARRRLCHREGENANGQRNTQGRVTSTYYSPTLGKGIAMGLVLNGPDRMGEEIEFAPPAKDPEGQGAAHGRRAHRQPGLL